MIYNISLRPGVVHNVLLSSTSSNQGFNKARGSICSCAIVPACYNCQEHVPACYNCREQVPPCYNCREK